MGLYSVCGLFKNVDGLLSNGVCIFLSIVFSLLCFLNKMSSNMQRFLCIRLIGVNIIYA